MALVPTTWNPADKGSGVTLSDGNLKSSYAAANSTSNVRAAAGVSAGKWYWEIKFVQTTPGQNDVWIGAWPKSRSITTNAYGTTGALSTYQQAATNDVYGIAFDADSGSIGFYKNGTFLQTKTGLVISGGDPWAPFAGDAYGGGTGGALLANFGASAFAYAAPAGYQAGIGIVPVEVRVGASSPLSPGGVAVLAKPPDVDCYAAGWRAASIGMPTAFAYMQPTIHRATTATPLPRAVFGTAQCDSSVIAQATGAKLPVTFGAASIGQIVQAAAYDHGTDFGTPSCVAAAHAAAWTVRTAFGAPRACRVFQAASVAEHIWFGAPIAQPSHLGESDSIPAGAHWGAHESARRQRGFPLARVARFGTPSLDRWSAC